MGCNSLSKRASDSVGVSTGGKGIMVLNLPNVLTLLRILLIPVFIEVYQISSSWHSQIAASVFLLASATDFLDGYVARRCGQITKLGRLLDPVADKLLIVSALILLVAYDRVSSWLAILIVGREFAVMGLRSIALSEGITIPVETTGKYKMVLQTAAIFFLILDSHSIFLNFRLLGTVLLWLSVIMAIVSGGQYFYRFWREMALRAQ